MPTHPVLLHWRSRQGDSVFTLVQTQPQEDCALPLLEYDNIVFRYDDVCHLRNAFHTIESQSLFFQTSRLRKAKSNQGLRVAPDTFTSFVRSRSPQTTPIDYLREFDKQVLPFSYERLWALSDCLLQWDEPGTLPTFAFWWQNEGELPRDRFETVLRGGLDETFTVSDLTTQIVSLHLEFDDLLVRMSRRDIRTPLEAAFRKSRLLKEKARELLTDRDGSRPYPQLLSEIAEISEEVANLLCSYFKEGRHDLTSRSAEATREIPSLWRGYSLLALMVRRLDEERSTTQYPPLPPGPPTVQSTVTRSPVQEKLFGDNRLAWNTQATVEAMQSRPTRMLFSAPSVMRQSLEATKHREVSALTRLSTWICRRFSATKSETLSLPESR